MSEEYRKEMATCLLAYKFINGMGGKKGVDKLLGETLWAGREEKAVVLEGCTKEMGRS